MSRGDSPRESCISSERSTTGWPPSSATPTSKLTRVRVEGRSKISATLRCRELVRACGACLSSAARASSADSSLDVNSTGEEVTQARECTLQFVRPMRGAELEPFHGRSVPESRRDLFDEFAAALAGWEWDVALLQEVPAVVAGAARGRLRVRWSDRADLAQRVAGRAARGGGPPARPDQLERRAAATRSSSGTDRSPSIGSRGCAGCRSGAGCTLCRLDRCGSEPQRLRSGCVGRPGLRSGRARRC